MDMTLDECLEEVDKWKASAIRRTSHLTPEQREQERAALRSWIKEKLGRCLPEPYDDPQNRPVFQDTSDRII